MQTLTKEVEKTHRLTGPVQFMAKLIETWRLKPETASAMLGFGSEGGEQLQRILCGKETLDAEEQKERIVHLFRIRATLAALFEDERVENEWLRERHSLLRENEPMTLLLEGSMENLLLVKEYVETMAGL